MKFLSKKEIQKNFVKIPNELFTDKRLCSGSKVLLGYLFSLPEDWIINDNDIMNKLGIGSKNTLTSYKNELIDSGWLERTLVKEGSKFGTYVYTLNCTLLITKTLQSKEGVVAPEKEEEKEKLSIEAEKDNNDVFLSQSIEMAPEKEIMSITTNFTGITSNGVKYNKEEAEKIKLRENKINQMSEEEKSKILEKSRQETLRQIYQNKLDNHP